MFGNTFPDDCPEIASDTGLPDRSPPYTEPAKSPWGTLERSFFFYLLVVLWFRKKHLKKMVLQLTKNKSNERVWTEQISGLKEPPLSPPRRAKDIHLPLRSDPADDDVGLLATGVATTGTGWAAVLAINGRLASGTWRQQIRPGTRTLRNIMACSKHAFRLTKRTRVYVLAKYRIIWWYGSLGFVSY